MKVIDFFRVVPKRRVVKIKAKQGIIYHNPPTSKKLLFMLGNLIFVFSLSYFLYLYLPLGRALFNYKFTKPTEVSQLITNTNSVTKPNTNEYKIIIPKISADSEVVAGVSPFNKNEYLKVLENNVVAQAKDTAIPGSGKGNTIYIFAHSTQQGLNMVRKNSIFYLLDQLATGDMTYIKYHGEILGYKVFMKKVVNAWEIEYFNYRDQNKEVLILQTCWPIGTDWKRLLVFAGKE